MGRLRCNIVMLGYKQDWRAVPVAAVRDYVGIIHDAFDRDFGVAVLRLTTCADVSTAMQNLVRAHARSRLSGWLEAVGALLAGHRRSAVACSKQGA